MDHGGLKALEGAAAAAGVDLIAICDPIEVGVGGGFREAGGQGDAPGLTGGQALGGEGGGIPEKVGAVALAPDPAGRGTAAFGQVEKIAVHDIGHAEVVCRTLTLIGIGYAVVEDAAGPDQLGVGALLDGEAGGMVGDCGCGQALRRLACGGGDLGRAGEHLAAAQAVGCLQGDLYLAGAVGRQIPQAPGVLRALIRGGLWRRGRPDPGPRPPRPSRRCPVHRCSGKR